MYVHLRFVLNPFKFIQEKEHDKRIKGKRTKFNKIDRARI